VFVLTGLALRLEDVRAAFSAKRAALFGLLSTLVLSPALAIPLMRYAPLYAPALAPEFLAGLALVCCVPTTLTTGVILTAQAGGNAALTLLLVIITNVLGVFTIPYALSAVFGSAAGLALDPAPMLAGLAKTILAPLLAGIALRCARIASRFFSAMRLWMRVSDAYRAAFSSRPRRSALVPGLGGLVDRTRGASRLLQQACLVATPWMTISSSAARLLSVSPTSLATAAAAAAALHVALLTANSVACAALRLGGNGRTASAKVRRAVVLAASQKTLPVSVAVLAQLGAQLGEPGLVLLPCIAFHLLQIVIDSALVGAWRAADGR
jgi:sodium/bile acid cotransporter 7